MKHQLLNDVFNLVIDVRVRDLNTMGARGSTEHARKAEGFPRTYERRQESQRTEEEGEKESLQAKDEDQGEGVAKVDTPTL